MYVRLQAPGKWKLPSRVPTIAQIVLVQKKILGVPGKHEMVGQGPWGVVHHGYIKDSVARAEYE